RHRLPARYRDELPESPTPLPPPPVFIPEPDPESVPEPRTSSPPKWVQTEPNAFGVYKVFPKRPTHDPEDSICLDDLCRSSTLSTAEPPPPAPFPDSPSTDPWFPFLNATVARLMSWFHSGSNFKSNGELNSLVHGVMLHKEFEQEHLTGFSAERENKRLDDAVNALPGEPPDGWSVGSVKLKLPAPKVAVPEVDAPEFEVSGILYR
ncbi:hypothetical protein B0H14DRAFT_3587272, partial [Mycena olivaceomarginata]